MSPKFVAFDAFGTLVHGNSTEGPYAVAQNALGLQPRAFKDAVSRIVLSTK